MIRTCEECNKQFEGHRNAHYCPECRLKLQREAHRRYEASHKERKKINARNYYLRHREQLLAKQKARYKETYEYKRGPIDRQGLTGWTIEYIKNGDLWTWSARKGNVVLDAGRDFETLRIAQKDCLLAIG